MGGGPGGQPRQFPKPTNLKVLDKDMTGAQVRDVMRKWEGDLGGECNSCHDEYDDHRKNERGQPQLDFAKDGKPEKEMARIMYTMTEDLKKDQIKKVTDLVAPAARVECSVRRQATNQRHPSQNTQGSRKLPAALFCFPARDLKLQL